MTDQDTQELQRIVEADPFHPGTPDLAAVRAGGQRALRRRRASTAVGAVAAVAAIAAPAYVVADAMSGPDRERGADVPVAGAPTQQPPPDGCGLLVCDDAGGRERGTVTGEPLVVSSAGGFDELLYAADGALMLGYRDGGDLRRAVWVTEPGSGPKFWSNVGVVAGSEVPPGAPESLVVVGYVDGAPEEITWSSLGESGPVAAMSTEVIDGATVFAAAVPLPEGFDAGGFEKTRVDGADAFAIEPGDQRPEVTISTSDGWSCTLSECGSVG